MSQWFIVYLLMWQGSTFSPGMHPVKDNDDCTRIGKAYILEMKQKGYDHEDDTKKSWAQFHCIELPYNGKL